MAQQYAGHIPALGGTRHLRVVVFLEGLAARGQLERRATHPAWPDSRWMCNKAPRVALTLCSDFRSSSPAKARKAWLVHSAPWRGCWTTDQAARLSRIEVPAVERRAVSRGRHVLGGSLRSGRAGSSVRAHRQRPGAATPCGGGLAGAQPAGPSHRLAGSRGRTRPRGRGTRGRRSNVAPCDGSRDVLRQG